MRLLIFHGYLLRGTGSNVYNAELARALTAAGHEVHLLCQDVAPDALDFVDAVGDWERGGLRIRELSRPRPQGWGRCVVYRPDIGDLLPVYVADRYERFTARPFPELSESELERYLSGNVEAVGEVCAIAGPQRALANHMVMGPAILARALPREVPYAVKIHGSAMEYTVRPNPRFLPYATEGLDRCATVLVGSRHIANRLWDTVSLPGLRERTFLGPPGVDVDRFAPRERRSARLALGEIAERVEALPRRGYGRAAAARTAALYARSSAAGARPGYEDVAAEVASMHTGYDTAGIDESAPDALRALAAVDAAPIVLYVGKLIVSKGVDLLLAAWPLVRREHPNARLAIVGFGAYREGLELLLAALSDGDLESARWLAEGGRAFEGGPAHPLDHLLAFLASLRGDERRAYLDAAHGMRETVHWLGRLEHGPLAELLPAADAQVVPSTFPEAFGMVAAEAAACGVPPVCARHSGLAEVTEVLERRVAEDVAPLLSFGLGDTAVRELADRLLGLLALGVASRERLRTDLATAARAEFSWARVAAEVVAAAGGEHDRLRRP